MNVSSLNLTDFEKLRICFALPGLHRVNRGAETAFEWLASEIARIDGCEVTLFGSGQPDKSRPYHFIHVPCRPRERFEKWPKFPGLRTEAAWEEFSFLASLRKAYEPSEFDVSVTCSYPYTNWFLRTRKTSGYRPAHVYVTQNGDWPCHSNKSEFRWFGCDGLICTNPEYFDRNRDRWNCELIPNGVNPEIFQPGPSNRRHFNLPDSVPIVLMVSALIDSKRVLEGIEAVSLIEQVHLVVAGDGPLRDQIIHRARERLGNRFTHLRLQRDEMPELYRCADVFLHMSLDEPSANAYIEALATGLPIVTHDRKVTQWTLEDCGMLVDCCDLSRVADTIQVAIGQQNPDRHQRQDSLVRKRFTWNKIARDYASFMRGVCDGMAQRGK